MAAAEAEHEAEAEAAVVARSPVQIAYSQIDGSGAPGVVSSPSAHLSAHHQNPAFSPNIGLEIPAHMRRSTVSFDSYRPFHHSLGFSFEDQDLCPTVARARPKSDIHR